MRKLALVTVMLVSLLMSPAILADAFDMAKLKIHLSGPVRDRSYFLCLSNNGCSRISPATSGRTYWMDAGNVSWMFAASMKNLTMRTQTLPKSCQVNVAKNQMLTVTGKLIIKDKSPYIGNLQCSVT